jgi:hypothetical protein
LRQKVRSDKLCINGEQEQLRSFVHAEISILGYAELTMNSTVRLRWVPPSQVQVPTFQIHENSLQVLQRELHIISMKLQREELHNSNTLKVIVVSDPANQNQHNQEKKKCSNKKLQGKSVTDKSI